MVVKRTFLHAAGPPHDLSFAMHEPSGDITPAVISDLPKPDLLLDRPCPPIKYTHRTWRDADLYFFFNQSDKEQTRTALVTGHGQAQVWDLRTGLIHPMRDAVAKPDGVQLPLVFEPYEAKVIVIGPLPPGVSTPAPELLTRETVQELTGDWSLSYEGKNLTTPLKSWQDLGIDSNNPVVYKKEFTLASKPAGKRLLLECGDIRDYARVRLNGVDLQARAWQPYRWDITRAVRPGRNVLKIEVRAVPARRRPPPVPVNPAAANRNSAGAGGGIYRRPTAPRVSGLLGPVRLVACN